MKLIKRRAGSQRSHKALTLEFTTNWGGQGGLAYLQLHDKEHNTYYTIHLDDLDEAKVLLSHAHIVYNNMVDLAERRVILDKMGIRK